MIRLRFCTIQWTPAGCITAFPQITPWLEVSAEPHDTHHYHVIAHRLGYGDDIMAYCREHEFAHAFVSERLSGEPSPVLLYLAQGRRPPRGPALMEEMAAQGFQRWLRANERPILSGADWDALKRDALALLDAENAEWRAAA